MKYFILKSVISINWHINFHCIMVDFRYEIVYVNLCNCVPTWQISWLTLLLNRYVLQYITVYILIDLWLVKCRYKKCVISISIYLSIYIHTHIHNEIIKITWTVHSTFSTFKCRHILGIIILYVCVFVLYFVLFVFTHYVT